MSKKKRQEAQRRVSGRHAESRGRRARTRVGETATRPAMRRDDEGQLWSLSQVEAEVFAIVAGLTPGLEPGTVGRDSRFRRDLGWDEWSKLRVVKPVLKRLHELLSDYAVKKLKKVGDLVDYVWAKMEDVP